MAWELPGTVWPKTRRKSLPRTRREWMARHSPDKFDPKLAGNLPELAERNLNHALTLRIHLEHVCLCLSVDVYVCRYVPSRMSGEGGRACRPYRSPSRRSPGLTSVGNKKEISFVSKRVSSTSSSSLSSSSSQSNQSSSKMPPVAKPACHRQLRSRRRATANSESEEQ